ncbi:CRISPR-associated endonuclease Cas3'', partial [Roseibium sp. RKSG952]|nr:CRISPR-associated endonuclease Cas3'' [Roseibium sp. RKSG952]
MLDVAAVSERLMAVAPFDPELKQAFALLIALHDLGKISESFRDMLAYRKVQTLKHWELSEVLLFEFDGELGARLGGEPWTRQQLYAAVAGHHGRPSQLQLGGLSIKGRRHKDYSNALKAVGHGHGDARKVVSAFCDLWGNASLGSFPPLDEAARAA